MKKIIITIDGEDEAWLHIYAKSMKMNCKEAAKRLLLREIQTMKEWSTSFASPIKQTTIHSARIKDALQSFYEADRKILMALKVKDVE